MEKDILGVLKNLIKILKIMPQCHCFAEVRPAVNKEFSSYMKELEDCIKEIEYDATQPTMD